ncbi:unnamed protein product [Acholeplasma phage MV-L51]|uniref:Uncharacterized protein n=1 Tax=Acholeplasma phage MV-L51 TaxID=1977403 RepID=Q04393_9VIRU|nr:hypothetical protein L1_3 [Acholeplasma phage MV-L51]CAA41650.1 unnamed protein product [Acholeplasma phage MV-L51]
MKKYAKLIFIFIMIIFIMNYFIENADAFRLIIMEVLQVQSTKSFTIFIQLYSFKKVINRLCYIFRFLPFVSSLSLIYLILSWRIHHIVGHKMTKSLLDMSFSTWSLYLGSILLYTQVVWGLSLLIIAIIALYFILKFWWNNSQVTKDFTLYNIHIYGAKQRGKDLTTQTIYRRFHKEYNKRIKQLKNALKLVFK